jgi:predicted nucleic acid-binding protein
LIVDTGPIVAAAIRTDPDHERCRDLLQTAPGPLVVPVLVIAEVAYLLDRELGAGADAAFYRSIADRELLVEPVAGSDWARMAELV